MKILGREWVKKGENRVKNIEHGSGTKMREREAVVQVNWEKDSKRQQGARSKGGRELEEGSGWGGGGG